jgi:hypothetical protein
MARYAHQAESPYDITNSRLKVNTGPQWAVTGPSSSPGSGREVFHIRFTPSG